MDAMLSYGDHQQVIGGIFENVHSMEVRAGAYLYRRVSAHFAVRMLRNSYLLPFYFVR
jgi:hypothetical protein